MELDSHAQVALLTDIITVQEGQTRVTSIIIITIPVEQHTHHTVHQDLIMDHHHHTMARHHHQKEVLQAKEVHQLREAHQQRVALHHLKVHHHQRVHHQPRAVLKVEVLV